MGPIVAVVSAIALFALFFWRFGWRKTLLLTLPGWLLLNVGAAVLLERVCG